MTDRIDVDAARRDIGGDQDTGLSGTEAFQGALARTLRFVAMDGVSFDAAFFQLFGDAIGAVFGPHENDDPGHVRRSQDIGQKRNLGLGLNVMDVLVDTLNRGCLLSNFNAHGVGQNLAGKLGNVTRHGGREQKRLTALRQSLGNLAHVAYEAHIEHTIGLVENEVLDAI